MSIYNNLRHYVKIIIEFKAVKTYVNDKRPVNTNIEMLAVTSENNIGDALLLLQKIVNEFNLDTNRI